MNFDIPLCIAWCFKQMKDKILHIVRRQPSCTKSYGNFTCSQVFRLHLLKCFHIDLIIFRIEFCRVLCNPQLLPDITRKVFISHQILRFVRISILIKRIQEDNTLQILKDFILRFAGKLHHIVHINRGFFSKRYRQCFACRINRSNRGMRLDCSLGKHISLTLQFSVLSDYLQCGKQRERTVLRKSRSICTAVNESVLT